MRVKFIDSSFESDFLIIIIYHAQFKQSKHSFLSMSISLRVKVKSAFDITIITDAV